jgi:hypothetical protein
MSNESINTAILTLIYICETIISREELCSLTSLRMHWRSHEVERSLDVADCSLRWSCRGAHNMSTRAHEGSAVIKIIGTPHGANSLCRAVDRSVVESLFRADKLTDHD